MQNKERKKRKLPSALAWEDPAQPIEEDEAL